MANDCWNRVTITGDSDTLNKLKNMFDTHPSLNYSNYHEMFVTDVSDMKGEDWGPKWFLPYAEMVDEELIVTGDSAWSPAIEFFEVLTDEYPIKCDFWYDERGFDFAGHVTIEEGYVDTHVEWTYWEGLYLNDREQFIEEIYECAGWCEDFDEVKETISLDKWKVTDTTAIDLSEFEAIFEKAKAENES
jgi:hypothetical protein